METIKFCDLCEKEKFSVFLEAKDYFLTQEKFTIVKCENCGFLFVNPRPTVNEISKYYKSEKYISHSTSQQGLLNKIYTWIRKKNHKKKYKLISQYKKLGAILDIGCATGEFLSFLKSKGWSVTGIEPNENARNFAINTYDIGVFPENAMEELGDGMYDIVSMWHVLEHVHNLNERLNIIYRLLKNDGIAIIAVPNQSSFDAAYYKKKWAGYDLPRHLYHFTTETIKILFEKNNFHFIEKTPMKYDAYYISLMSEKYKNKKQNLLKAFFQGHKSNAWAKRNDNEYSSLIYIFKKGPKISA